MTTSFTCYQCGTQGIPYTHEYIALHEKSYFHQMSLLRSAFRKLGTEIIRHIIRAPRVSIAIAVAYCLSMWVIWR